MENNSQMVTDDLKIGLRSQKNGAFFVYSYVFYVHFLAFWANIRYICSEQITIDIWKRKS